MRTTAVQCSRRASRSDVASIVHHSRKLWRLGLREFAWGFAHQGPAGNFPDTQDPFHSTSFFVEGVAHVILILRGAAANRVAVPRHLLAAVNAFLPASHKAARWMVSRGVSQAGLSSQSDAGSSSVTPSSCADCETAAE